MFVPPSLSLSSCSLSLTLFSSLSHLLESISQLLPNLPLLIFHFDFISPHLAFFLKSSFLFMLWPNSFLKEAWWTVLNCESGTLSHLSLSSPMPPMHWLYGGKLFIDLSLGLELPANFLWLQEGPSFAGCWCVSSAAPAEKSSLRVSIFTSSSIFESIMVGRWWVSSMATATHAHLICLVEMP